MQYPARAAGVTFRPRALDEIHRLTKGYSYFVQEWGYQSWNRAPHTPITLKIVKEATTFVIPRFDQNFFRVRYDRLTPSEKNFLRAMAELGAGPQRTSDIADAMRVKISSLGPVRAKLVREGMIYSLAHAEMAFTVLPFDAFMIRAIPEVPALTIALGNQSFESLLHAEGFMASKKSSKKKSSVVRILNVIPSPDVQRDWYPENAEDAGLLTAAPLPASKDLREKWWAISDQGSTGACVGFATADSVLRWHFVKAGRIKSNELLSPRFHWMAAKETDQWITPPTTFIEAEGTSLKAALDIARKFGAVTDKMLPFATGALYGGEAKSFYAAAAQLKITSYFNLGTNLADWRKWLAQNGPILTRLDVDSTWDAAKQNGGKLQTYNPLSTRGGHAVALVGYRPGEFIVRNSWGTTDWGDKGFGYASDAYAQAAFTEAYGVTI